MSLKLAVKVKDVPSKDIDKDTKEWIKKESGIDFVQHQTLYECDPPFPGWSDRCEPHRFVVCSAISVAFDTKKPETYIFAANEDGTVADYAELPGSLRGTTKHKDAFTKAGYLVITDEPDVN